MENGGPVTFHGGQRKRFNRERNFEEAFSGDDANEKNDRYDFYQRYYEKIEKESKKLRAEMFEKSMKEILQFLLSPKTSSKDIVNMAAIMFSDTAIPARNEFFDGFVTSNIGNFCIARMKTGSVYNGVESVVQDVVKQLLQRTDPCDDDGGFRSYLPHWKKIQNEKDGILVILDDVLSFDAQVLDDLLLVISLYKSLGLPFFVLAGFPQSNSPSSILTHKILRKYALELITVSMDSAIKEILLFVSTPTNIPLQLSPTAFKLLARTATENGLTCEELLNAFKLVILEHFRSKPGSIQCLSSADLTKQAVEGPNSRRTKMPAGDVKTVLEADDYRRTYWIAANILVKLASLDPDLSARGIEDHVDAICVSVAEDFLESELLERLFSNLSNLEPEEVVKFMEACERIMEEDKGVKSSITEFRKRFLDLLRDFNHLEELQEEENKRNQEANADGEKKRSRLRENVNPNRSTRLTLLQNRAVETREKSACQVDILGKKRKELEKALKTLFEHALVPPSIDAVATMYFDDIDFLRQVLSASSRKFLAAAMANPKFGLRFDIYDNSGVNIDLSKWFDAFCNNLEENNDLSFENDDALVAQFYKMLSAMEFVGFIGKGRKKDSVTKLCWSSCSM